MRILSQAVRRIESRLRPGPRILLYHRVTELTTDPQLLAVSPTNFEEQLRWLRRQAVPMRLGTAVKRMQEGTLPKRAVVITFDDGYEDNSVQAKRLLERYEIPATVFVTTEAVQGASEFWWDDLDRIFLQPGDLPENLELDLDGTSYRKKLGISARYPPEMAHRHSGWTVLHRDTPTRRHAVYRKLHRLIRPLRPSSRTQVMHQLWNWAGVSPQPRSSHKALSAEQLQNLADGELIEIGAHTVRHPLLAAMPEDLQRSEISESRRHLEEIIGKDVVSFAYPFGSLLDYSPRSVGLVAEAGFQVACSNFPGALHVDRDPRQLPRMLVRDWDGDAFGKRHLAWSGG